MNVLNKLLHESKDFFSLLQIVIEFIQDNPEARYEDLLNKVQVLT